jgi:hypothetical protein
VTLLLFFRFPAAGAIESPLNVRTIDSHPPADLTAPIVAGIAGLLSPPNDLLAYRAAITAEAERLRATRDAELNLLDATMSLPIGVVEQAEDALLRTIHTNTAFANERAAELREMKTAIRDPRPASRTGNPISRLKLISIFDPTIYH